MNSLTKRYVISKDASEVIDLLRFLSIVFVVLIHNTPVVPSRISFSSGMGQWFYGLMRHTILDPPIYVFFMISGLLLFRKPFGALENMKKSANFVGTLCILESILDRHGVCYPKNLP